MEATVQIYKFTFLVNGQEMTFSEGEIQNILKRHFDSVKEVVKTPIEGKSFRVDPKAISQDLFAKKRKDSKQESTRKLILEAFEEMAKQPQKYSNPFKTMIPIKTWDMSKTTKDLDDFARSLGGYMADWVEQALEWAQRISNGESWEDICNNIDTSGRFCRLINWKNGYARAVGGSDGCNSATFVYEVNFVPDYRISCAVPLVVFREAESKSN